MKAIVYTEYGSPEVLQLKELVKPTPKETEILIKVYATSVTAGDYRMRSFKVPFGFWLLGRLAMGLRRPKKTILGTEFAGKIEAVGQAVSTFQAGDEVFGFTGADLGAYAEYLCLPEAGMVIKKPAVMSYEESAAVPFGALTALFFLRDKARLQAGEKVLIYGAAGGVGTAAVQLARSMGAQVTGVCSTANLEMVKSLGADRVIDYTKEDFSQQGEHYDVILETVGKCSIARCKAALKPEGRCVLVAAGLPGYFQMLWTAIRGGKQVITGYSPEKNREDLLFIKSLIEAGQFKSAIDKRFPFVEMVKAHHYVDLGHKKGNVVITVASTDPA